MNDDTYKENTIISKILIIWFFSGIVMSLLALPVRIFVDFSWLGLLGGAIFPPILLLGIYTVNGVPYVEKKHTDS